MKLLRVDQLTLPDHYHLSGEDECYYLGEYTARQGFAHSFTNGLIMNLKKSVVKKANPEEYKWKLNAIQKCATMLSNALTENHFRQCTIVPVPPSKAKSDPLYDDRLTAILQRLCQLQADGLVDFRELVTQTSSMVSSHESDSRPKPPDLVARYQVDLAQSHGIRDFIVIFDDVLTTGSHFKAMQSVLSRAFPDKQIVGVFIARTERSSDLHTMFDEIL